MTITRISGIPASRKPEPASLRIPPALIDAITEHIADRHSTINSDDQVILALLCIYTHFYMDCPKIPYFLIAAPGNSGKGEIKRILRDLCYAAQVVFPTVASLSRFRDSDRHTAIIDEIQRLVKGRNNYDRESLYALFDLGYEPGNIWQVSAAPGMPGSIDRDPFFPKIFLGTDSNIFEERTAERCHVITFTQGTLDQQDARAERQRTRPISISVASLKSRITALFDNPALHAIIKKLAADPSTIYINDNLRIGNREADIWRPLIIIADLTDGKYSNRIREIIARRVDTEPVHIPTKADLIDTELRKIMRSNALTMFNWFKGQKYSPLPNGVWPMSNADFGWPRKSFKGRLPEASLFFDSATMTAQMRFRSTEFSEICAAIGWKRSEVISAYRLAGRLDAQRDKNQTRSTKRTAFISGHGDETLVIIDVSCWLWPHKISIPGSSAFGTRD
jgi:hypothetical protein